MTNDAIIEIRNVSKTFFGVHALENVSLSVERGHTLGLIGENGAGKSTLMNILGGVVQPDAGSELLLNGTPYAPRNPADADKNGIAFIHQELNLFTNLTIAENIFIDGFPRVGGLFINRREMFQRTRELLQSINLDLSPDALIDDLSPGERQLVEITKVLHKDASVVIFDEPTTSLTNRETEQLFEIIQQLKDSGKTMIYISHILDDVLRVADDIAVLRDGELVGDGAAAEFDTNRMISMMIGRDLEQMFPPRSNAPSTEAMLTVTNLSQPGIVKDINLQLHRGEVLGLFGLMGSGRTELARIIFGLDEYAAGDITIEGKSIGKHAARDSIRNRIAFVTEDRRKEGLMMEANLVSNLSLVSIPSYANTPLQLVDGFKVYSAARDVSGALRIKAGDLVLQSAKSLSGGNQQKVVIGKWLLSEPTVFIMDEPTRGVDVGAKYEIYSIIDNLAAQGNSVLFISSELDELMGMCDRILVMSQGEIVGEFAQRPFSEEDILRAAFREEVPV